MALLGPSLDSVYAVHDTTEVYRYHELASHFLSVHEDSTKTVQIREVADDDIVAGVLCGVLRRWQKLRHRALGSRGHLVLQPVHQLCPRESHGAPRPLKLRIRHILGVATHRNKLGGRAQAKEARVGQICGPQLAPEGGRSLWWRE